MRHELDKRPHNVHIHQRWKSFMVFLLYLYHEYNRNCCLPSFLEPKLILSNSLEQSSSSLTNVKYSHEHVTGLPSYFDLFHDIQGHEFFHSYLTDWPYCLSYVDKISFFANIHRPKRNFLLSLFERLYFNGLALSDNKKWTHINGGRILISLSVQLCVIAP